MHALDPGRQVQGLLHAHRSLGTEPAALAPRPAGVLDQPVSLVDHGVLRFHQLDRAVMGVAVVDADRRAHPVLGLLGAPAAADRSRGSDDHALLVGHVAVELSDPEIGEMACGDPVGDRRCERSEDGVDHRHRYRHPQTKRCGADRAHDPARRVDHLQRAEAPVVDRVVGRRGQALIRDLGGAVACGRTGVVETAHLLRDVRQVDGHPVAGHRRLHPDRDALADVDPVIVHVGLCLVDAIGDGARAFAGRPFGFEHDCVHRRQHLLAAVAVQQLGEASFAGAHRGELSPQVAHRPIGQMDVHLDDVDQVLVELAAPLELEDRDLEPLGVDVGGHPAQDASDIEPVRHADRKRGQFSAVEDRQAQGNVVEMAAGDVAVIGDQDVARLDIVAEIGELGLQGLRHAADEHRQPEPDGDSLAARVEHPGREVERLVDDHVVGGAHEVGLHFLGHRHHTVAHDFGDDGIGAARLFGVHDDRFPYGGVHVCREC